MFKPGQVLSLTRPIVFPIQCLPTFSMLNRQKISQSMRVRMLRSIVLQVAIHNHVSLCQYFMLLDYHSLTSSPLPRTGIIWRRDDGSPIIMRASNNRSRKSDTFEGELINFLNVDRQQSGAYLCIAKNDVPPAVSKRVFLSVNCKLKAQAV